MPLIAIPCTGSGIRAVKALWLCAACVIVSLFLGAYASAAPAYSIASAPSVLQTPPLEEYRYEARSHAGCLTHVIHAVPSVGGAVTPTDLARPVALKTPPRKCRPAPPLPLAWRCAARVLPGWEGGATYPIPPPA